MQSHGNNTGEAQQDPESSLGGLMVPVTRPAVIFCLPRLDVTDHSRPSHSDFLLTAAQPGEWEDDIALRSHLVKEDMARRPQEASVRPRAVARLPWYNPPPHPQRIAQPRVEISRMANITHVLRGPPQT